MNNEKESKTLEEEIGKIITSYSDYGGDAECVNHIASFIRSKLKAEAEKAWEECGSIFPGATEAEYFEAKKEFLSQYDKP